MPGFVGVADFVDDTKEDFKNPTISSFADKIPQLKKTVNVLEEVNGCFSDNYITFGKKVFP